MVGMLILAAVIGLPCLGTGISLILLGSRGVYVTGRCACGYDLSRLLCTTARCPECGCKRGHVSIRSTRMLYAGVAILLLPVVILVGLMTMVIWRTI